MDSELWRIIEGGRMPYSYSAIGQEAVSGKSVVTAPRMPNRVLSLFSLMSMKFVTNYH